MRVVNNGKVLVRVEMVYEKYLSKKLDLIYVNAVDLLPTDNVASNIPKRVYGTVIDAPTPEMGYKGPRTPILYKMEDIDTDYDLQHPSFRENGMSNIITSKAVKGTHGEVYYTNTIQDFIPVGSTVWFQHTATGKSKQIDEGVYAMGPEQILGYQQEGGQFTPFGGRIWLEPVYPNLGKLILPDSVKPVATSGRVVFMGKPLRGGYRTDFVQIGSEVEFPASRRWEVEMSEKTYVVVDGEQITKIIKI